MADLDDLEDALAAYGLAADSEQALRDAVARRPSTLGARLAAGREQRRTPRQRNASTRPLVALVVSG